jgi:DNA repair protein RecO (recombination protein O)
MNRSAVSRCTLFGSEDPSPTQISTPAILIRRTAYGDYDLIVTCFSLSSGKISLIAKSAQKSARRFAGVLELFSEMDILGSTGRRGGLPVLQEACLRQPFQQIRAVPSRMAYASYWAELVHDWMEDRVEQKELYHLLRYALSELNQGRHAEAVLSIVFQMRFLRISGHRPNLERCVVCRRAIEDIRPDLLSVDLVRGGIACRGCVPPSPEEPLLSKGAAKQLHWVAGGDLARAARMKFSAAAVGESLEMLERFVPYHLGRQPRSLKVLRQLRGDGN